MKPLCLSFEGLTCFKERQRIDFTELDLFAISGPTGAGKSSVLDAMIFALYGQMPRVSKSYSELISLGRDRLAVSLDFRVTGRDFRVSRTGYRGRPSEAFLEEVSGGAVQPLAEGVREVNAHIEKLLGLHFDAFTQSVVLPQGDFAKFLKSPPAERRKILRDLLRLHVYERMREQAFLQQRDLDHEVRGLDARLEQDFAGATPEVLEEHRARHARFARELQESAEALKQAEARLGELKHQHRRTKELAGRRTEQQLLLAEAPRMTEREAALQAARRAAPLVELLGAASEAEQRLREEERHQQEAAGELDRAREAHEQATARLTQVEEDAKQIPQLRERIRRLDEVKGLLSTREAAYARRAKARAQQEKLKEDLTSARLEAEEAGARLAEGKKALAAVTAERDAIGYDAKEDEALDGARELAMQVGHLRQAEAAEREEAAQAEKKLAAEKAAAARAQTAAASALKDLQKIAQKVVELEEKQEEAHRREMAALLRRDLRVGDPCPVCEQEVHQRPKARAVPHVDEVESALAKAKQEQATISARAEQARIQLEASEHALASAKEAVTAAKVKADEATKQLAKLTRKLQTKAGKRVEGVAGETLDERVLAAAEAMRERKKRWEQAGREREKAEKALEKAKRDAEGAADAIRGLEARIKDQAAAALEAEAEAKKLNAEIARVTQHPDPAAERDELAQKLDTLDEARKTAQQAERESSAVRGQAETQLKAADRQVEQARKQADKARERARAAVRTAGFADEQAVQAATRSPEEIARLEEELAAWRSRRTALEQQIARLEAELASREVDDAALKAEEDGVATLRSQYEQGLKQDATLQQQIARLESDVAAARQLREQRSLRGRSLRTYSQLSDDLRSDHFQAYILHEILQELVAGASKRLMALSGRYTLEFRDEAFEVTDHDNAGERRSADTLSGGETFLASLSLALQLSEQVQRAAGSVVLDSLFIDEGFGTLDPETLETVAEAIESLPAGGRMVGIITHIPELTARLPARIVISKHADGSNVRTEHDS